MFCFFQCSGTLLLPLNSIMENIKVFLLSSFWHQLAPVWLEVLSMIVLRSLTLGGYLTPRCVGQGRKLCSSDSYLWQASMLVMVLNLWIPSLALVCNHLRKQFLLSNTLIIQLEADTSSVRKERTQMEQMFGVLTLPSQLQMHQIIGLDLIL